MHLKAGLTLDDVLRRTREHGIKAGVAINGGLSFPARDDASLDPFLKQLEGQPVYVAFQAEGREWPGLFSKAALSRFDYLFTDAMTWTGDDGRRMRLWIKDEVGVLPDAERFMETLVDRTVGILEREPIDLHVNPTFLPGTVRGGLRSALDAGADGQGDRGPVGARYRPRDQQPVPHPEPRLRHPGESGPG